MCESNQRLHVFSIFVIICLKLTIEDGSNSTVNYETRGLLSSFLKAEQEGNMTALERRLMDLEAEGNASQGLNREMVIKIKNGTVHNLTSSEDKTPANGFKISLSDISALKNTEAVKLPIFKFGSKSESKEKSAEDSDGESAKQPAEESAKQSAEESAQKSAEESANRSDEESAKKSAKKSAEQSAEESANESAEESAKQSTKKSAKQSAEKSGESGERIAICGDPGTHRQRSVCSQRKVCVVMQGFGKCVPEYPVGPWSQWNQCQRAIRAATSCFQSRWRRCRKCRSRQRKKCDTGGSDWSAWSPCGDGCNVKRTKSFHCKPEKEEEKKPCADSQIQWGTWSSWRNVGPGEREMTRPVTPKDCQHRGPILINQKRGFAKLAGGGMFI